MNDLADPIEAAGSAAVVASAVELGLIESLSDPAPAAEHASRLGLDPEATGLELEALVALDAELAPVGERRGRAPRAPDGRDGLDELVERSHAEPGHMLAREARRGGVLAGA